MVGWTSVGISHCHVPTDAAITQATENSYISRFSIRNIQTFLIFQ
jgi:hypothetical protein